MVIQMLRKIYSINKTRAIALPPIWIRHHGLQEKGLVKIHVLDNECLLLEAVKNDKRENETTPC